DAELVRIVGMRHVVHVANGLRFAHLASGVRSAEIIDARARPTLVWNARLRPLAGTACGARQNETGFAQQKWTGLRCRISLAISGADLSARDARRRVPVTLADAVDNERRSPLPRGNGSIDSSGSGGVS